MKQIREVCHGAFCSWNVNFLFVWFFCCFGVVFFPHVLSAWVPLQKYNSNYQSDSKCYHQPINSLSPPAFPLFFIPPCLYLAVQLSAARHSPLYRWATAVKEGREGKKKEFGLYSKYRVLLSSTMMCLHGHDTHSSTWLHFFFDSLRVCVWKQFFRVHEHEFITASVWISLVFCHNWIYNSSLSLSFSPSCSQAFWSYWDREDALPGNGVRQWRWDIDAVVSKVSPTCQTCELQPLGL